jgi:N-methylhydantoinase A/oxoprolinase/acetone carboxylase beta subunit
MSRKMRPAASLDCILDGRQQTAALIDREQLRSGDSFAGPAVISEYSATTLVPAGWQAKVDAYGQILLTKSEKSRRHARKN